MYEFKNALEYYNKLVKVDSNCYEAYKQIGFCYEKLKKNGVIVRKYSKDSILSTHLRITIPKIGGVKYIIELLNKKDVLLFSVDGTVIDIENSTMSGTVTASNKELLKASTGRYVFV